MQEIQVHAAPAYYECEVGVLDQLESYILNYHFKKVLVVHGVSAWEAAKPYFPVFQELDAHFVAYKMPCCDSGIAYLAQKAREYGAEAILGIGGGTIMDTVKALANELNQDAILIPTLAATCAPWTSLSVLYDDEGRFTRFNMFPRSPLMVLIEPRIIAASPVNYLRAGIADTLAKWYEARALTRHLKTRRVPVQLALETALLCKKVLLKDGSSALHALEKRELTEELLNIIEANILAGGLVGGLGDRYGRIAAAHSVHNALTQFKETQDFLHGEKVAYGILIQLGLDEEWEEVGELIAFYKQLQLPYSLAQMGLDINNSQVLDQIVSKTLAPEESIHFMSEKVTAAKLEAVLRRIENYSEES